MIRETGALAAGVTARARVRARAGTRARAFASFIVGLSHYGRALEVRAGGGHASGDLRAAARWFNVSRRAGWDPRAAHVLHLFLGNVALLRGEMDGAGIDYERALRFRGDYGRAQLGLAEVRFHEAIPACTSGRIPRALREAARGYRAVLAGAGPPLLEIKARYGLGRAAFCASEWRAAERAFHSVVATHDGGFREARGQAAGALGGLGAVALLRPDTERPDLKGAERHLNRAIELTPPSPDQGGLFALLGNAQARLGKRRAALRSYREAIRLNPAEAAAYRAEAEWLLGESPAHGGLQ